MRRLQARLASLEKRIVIPGPNAAMEEALQRALARLTCEELRQLIEAAELQEDGRGRELTPTHLALMGSAMISSLKKERSHLAEASYRYEDKSGRLQGG